MSHEPSFATLVTRAARPITAAVLVPLLLAGCAGSSSYMASIPKRPIVAPPTDAVVVFIRPSGLGFAINFAIVDQRGHWLGDAVAKSHFAVRLAPGEYTFVGWAENTAAMKASLAPGRVYYVEVEPSMGFGSAHVSLEALAPRRPSWPELLAWLNETQMLEPLPSGVDYIQSRQADAMARVKSAEENWRDYSASDKEARSLHPEDGIPSGAAAVPVVVAAVPGA